MTTRRRTKASLPVRKKKKKPHPLLNHKALVQLNTGDAHEGFIEEVTSGTSGRTVLVKEDRFHRPYKVVIPAFNILYYQEQLPKLLEGPSEPQ